MAQDILGGIVGDVLRGGDPTRRLEQQARREAQRAARDAATPDTVQSELREETVEQRRDRNNTLTGREMQDLLRVAERTGATIEMQPGRDEGTYVFTVNGRDRTAPLDVSPEALAVAQQSPLVEIAQPRTAPSRATAAPQQTQADHIGMLATLATADGLDSPGERLRYTQELQSMTGRDGKITIAQEYHTRINNAMVDIPAGQYTPAQFGVLVARESGIRGDDLTELETSLRRSFNEPAPRAQAASPEPVIMGIHPDFANPSTRPAPATNAPRLEVDPTVFSGDDRVTGGDRPAPAAAPAAPTVAPTREAPAAPTAAEPAAPVQTYTQQQLLDMGKEVTAAVTAGGADARAVEAFLGNRADSNGQLSETEATAALNRMQALNFSPEGRAQLAELSRALQGQGVSGGDSIAGGEQQAPRATQVAMAETGRSGGVTF